MITAFISLGLFDIIDILLVAFLLYQVYMLIKGSVAINIFVGLFFFYLSWLIVRAFNMELLSSILGQFIGVGVIALIIVFQQEIRRFMLLIGTKYNISQRFSLERFFAQAEGGVKHFEVEEIIESCLEMSASKTGALIVISKNSDLTTYIDTGVDIRSRISSAMISSVFFKNAPLHDGAMIILDDTIIAARCILPVTDSTDIPGSLGLRHRAAIGLTQDTDAHVVTVSEETGNISYVKAGKIKVRINEADLRSFLMNDFANFIN